MLAFTICQIGQRSVMSVFWTMPPMLLAGTAAAGGIALINAIGNLGGYFGPTVMGTLRDATGGYSGGLLVLAGGLILEAILVSTLKLPNTLSAARGPQPARFEVKARVARRGVLDATFGDVRVSGHVEEWLKWSYEGERLGPFVAGLLEHPARVAVEKERVQRKYDLAPGRIRFPRIAAGTEVVRGAYLELARVRAGGTTGWSVGVEAFGPPEDARLEEALHRLAGEVFRDCPRSLRLEESASYPGWLSALQ